MNKKYTKGSEWRKWDLQIHTPFSLKQEYGGNIDEVWEDFISDLEKLPVEFKAIGINDYIFLDGYKKVFEFKNNGRLENIDLILPVIELRIDKFGSVGDGAWRKVNFHIIFSNEVTAEVIEQQFLNAISHSHKLSAEFADLDFEGVITRKSLLDFGNKIKKSSDGAVTGSDISVGFDNIAYGYKEILKALKSTYFTNKFLTAVGKTEWDALRWDGLIAEKKTVINSSNLVLISSKSPEDFYNSKNKLKEQNVNDNLIDCSDAHHFSNKKDSAGDYIKDRIGKCFTWIKADPTFEGLKQIVFEPKNRVFIGIRPTILKRVEADKTKYLDSLDITQADSYDGRKGVWFKDINIEFNQELVAIIGKKGSGKSAIADIIGLLGDTHVNCDADTKENHFSFLNKKKFLKQDLAGNFKAKIIWKSGGGSDYKELNKEVDCNSPESVRYIPQFYFEKLTNELEIIHFKEVLEHIIFKYIPKHERHSKINFKELQEYKTKSIQEDIRISIISIEALNKEIINLERKIHPDYKSKIESKLEEKERELKTQELLKTGMAVVANPNENVSETDDNSKRYKNMEKLNEGILEIDSKIENKNNERRIINTEAEELNQIIKHLTRFDEEITKYKKDNQRKFDSYNLKIEDIIKTEFDLSSIKKVLSDKELKAKELNNILMSVTDIDSHEGDKEKLKEIGLIYKKDALLKKINEAKQELTEKEKKYQQYQENIKKIQEKQKEIEGDIKTPDTLEYYKAEKDFINNNLEDLLIHKRSERLEMSLKIYKKKTEVIELFRKFKKPVDKQVEYNKEVLDDYPINIESSFNLNKDFYKDYMYFINQSKSGSFYGKGEGGAKLEEIFTDKDFNDAGTIKEILEKVIEYLTIDKREGYVGAERYINDQVENIEGFYRFIFSLDYLVPKYELKLGDKKLDELSPGEKGTLLLVFYLMIDKENIPLIIDQPEDNLDNESIFIMLAKFIKLAKKRRQIIIVTHNPNLAVGADAEQIIHVDIEKEKEKGNKFNFKSGAIEAPEINKTIVDILEGTMPAFNKRKLQYYSQLRTN